MGAWHGWLARRRQAVAECFCVLEVTKSSELSACFCVFVQCAEQESDSFTVEVIHGGFFVGHGSNRAYVNGTKLCYDDCNADTWSALWFDDIIEDIGYESAGRIKVYWLLPGMQINEDGLRLIADDKDALTMIGKVKQGHRYLMLYLDHEPEKSALKSDDVVANPINNLPPVIGPSKKNVSAQDTIVEVNAEERIVAMQRRVQRGRGNQAGKRVLMRTGTVTTQVTLIMFQRLLTVTMTSKMATMTCTNSL